MKKRMVLFLLLLIASLIVTVVYSVVYYIPFIVENIVGIRTIGVNAFWDFDCTQQVQSINWGIVSPGETVIKSFFIKSTSSEDITMMLSVANMTPTNASQFLTLDWNYDNSTLQQDVVIPVNFYLTVSSDVFGITDFSFDMLITAVYGEEIATVITPTDDQWVTNAAPNRNYGNWKVMWVGIDKNGLYRSLVRFNVSNFSGLISSAKIKFYYYTFQQNNPVDRYIHIYKCLSVWSENSVTWNSAPSFNYIPTDVVLLSDKYGWIEFDVTNDIQAWINGEQNYGHLIKLDNEISPYTIIGGFTKEYGTYAPVLSVEVSG